MFNIRFGHHKILTKINFFVAQTDGETEIIMIADLCEPLISKKLHIICLSHNGQTTRCDKPLPANSKAIFTCNSLSYMEIERSKYNMINCKNGKWDRPLIDDFCVPGKFISNYKV